MADVTVTIGARDDGSFDAAVSTAKSKLAELTSEWTATAHTTGPLRFGGPLGTATEARARGRKQLEDLAAGFKQVTVAEKETAQATEEVWKATERAGGSFERLAGRIVMRLAIFEALRLAFDGIKNTIEAASQKQFDVVQFQNVAGAVGNINTGLAETERIAEATSQTFNEVYQARLKMYEAGVGFEEQGAAIQIAGELSRIWGEDARRLSEMEAHIRTGTASEEELYHIATLLGGKYREQADAYRDMLVQAPLIERAMERQKVLADRQFEDEQRIGNLRTSFYEAHGVAEQAFREKYRQVDATDAAAKEKAIYDASYQAREGLQKKFAQGQAQLQKDLGVSDTTMSELIDSGVIGSKELLEASRTAESERKRNADRAFQDQKSAIDLGKDQTKLKLLQQERDALFDQVKAQQTLNELVGKYNAEQKTLVGQAQAVGAELKRGQEDSGKMAVNAQQFAARLQPWERPKEAPEPGRPGSVERLEAHQRRIQEQAAAEGQQRSNSNDSIVAGLKSIERLLGLVFGVG